MCFGEKLYDSSGQITNKMWAFNINTGFIFIADAETDAKEDQEDKIKEDEKNGGNKEVPDTSLERKKSKRKKNQNNSAKTEEKEREGRK